MTACDDRRDRGDPPVVETEVVFTRGVRAGFDFDETVEVGAGVYSATLLSGDAHDQAISRGVRVD